MTTFADLQPGHVVGEEIVLNVWRNPGTNRMTISTTGRGYGQIFGSPTDEAPPAIGASPLAQKTWEIREFRATLAALEAERQELLPELPADLIADLDYGYQAECPESGCSSLLNAYAETDEVSPVLGWGPVTEVTYDPDHLKATYAEVRGVWLGDYEYGDASGPIYEIRCTSGHEFRAPAATDRNV